MKTNNDLLSCPFCGGTNIELDHTDISVVCWDCAAEGPFGDADMEWAIEAWNRRAEPIQPVREVSYGSLPNDLWEASQLKEDEFIADALVRIRALLAKYGSHPTGGNPDAL